MVAFDQPIYPKTEAAPIDVVLLRSRLIKEESKEYHAAPRGDIEELDGLIDLFYVVIGTSITFSVPFMVEPDIFTKHKEKYLLYDRVIPVTQDLDSRFPCHKRQTIVLNDLIRLLIFVGRDVGYDLIGAFDAVHENNMKKLWDIKPEDKSLIAVPKGAKWLVKDKGNKVIKSPSHTKVALTPFMPPLTVPAH